jgi:radical SAM protein with 4Fe4S-binding SPASM domain
MLERGDCGRSMAVEEIGERLATVPILVLNVHSRCNCRCVMCDIWKRSRVNEITAADMERHRESLRRLGVDWVVLTGGEPLMHGDLQSLCAFFRDLDIRLTLLSTGLLLSRRAAEVAALFEDIIISIDGPAAIHDSIRRVKGGFDFIEAGIAAVRELRPDMRITARMTVQKINHAHLREAVLSVRAIGMDGISLLAADLTSDAFNRPLTWPGERQQEVALTAEEIDTLERGVDELIAWCADDANRGYIAESPSKLRRIVQHFRAHLGQARFEAPKCNAPWVSAVVEADGSVRPCFFHPVVGNAHYQDLEEILNGEAARAFRNNLNMSDDSICRRCVCSLYRAGPTGSHRVAGHAAQGELQ